MIRIGCNGAVAIEKDRDADDVSEYGTRCRSSGDISAESDTIARNDELRWGSSRIVCKTDSANHGVSSEIVGVRALCRPLEGEGSSADRGYISAPIEICAPIVVCTAPIPCLGGSS